MTPVPVSTPEETKNQILHAAGERFRRYGFQKTSMAEIAKDCRMSAANLYRYFESKDDIGATIAAHHFADKERRWREVLQRQGLSASARLEALVLENLRCIFDEFCNEPRIFELVEYITREHWDLVQRHLDAHLAFVAEVLAEGNRTGEFEVADIVMTAELIQAATAKFCVPSLVVGRCSLPELEQLAKGVVALLIRGLAKR